MIRKKIISGYDKFLGALLNISVVLVLVSVLLACFNALSRRLFGHNFGWSSEVCIYTIVTAVYLTIPYLELHGLQICIDILHLVLKNKTILKVLYIIFGVCDMVVFILLFRYGLTAVETTIFNGITTEYIRMPKYILYAIADVSFALPIISWLIVFICNKGDKVE